MNTDGNCDKLDELISKTIARERTTFDFDNWKQSHEQEIRVFKSQMGRGQTSHSGRVLDAWRTIKRSNRSKIAAAAAVVVCISLSMILMDNTSSPAFGMSDVMAAMRKAEWMHITYEYAESDAGLEVAEPQIRESWLSVNPMRDITVFKNGDIGYTQYSTDQMRAQRYDAETNVLTTRYIPASVNSSYTSIVDKIFGDIAELEERGAAIEYTDSVDDSRPAVIMNVDFTDDNSVHGRGSILIDVETRLPKRATLISEQSGKSSTVDIVFDYPKTGPADVYQAGAPHEAESKVIGQKITGEFLDSIKPYRAARENLPQQRIVVEVAIENKRRSVVSVISTNGVEERFEQVRCSKNAVPPDTEDFRAILNWTDVVTGDKPARRRIHIKDGKVVHSANRDYSNPWTREKTSVNSYGVGFAPAGLIYRGWPRIRTGVCIENDHAKDNNLLCVETTSEPRFTGDSKLAEAAERILYYIDPEHDYMCVRIERFKHPVAPPWGRPAAEEAPAPDSRDIPTEAYLVTEVVQFGRTDTSHWYPSRIRTIDEQGWSDLGRGWEMRTRTFDIRLYIDTEPEVPKGIFDADRREKWENGKFFRLWSACKT